jgi:broad specificity phosphatase PhoE
MSILLIRHGETALNKALVVQTPDTPLSDRGLEQAGCLARRLARAGVSSILSSDMARAAMTASELAESTAAPLELDALLHERNFGDLRGRAYVDIGVDIFAPSFAPPGGETWPAFHARVDRAWERIRECAAVAEGHLAVVTHGLVLHSILARHVSLPEEMAPAASFSRDGPPLHFGNTALTVLQGCSPWRVELFSCTAHLEHDPA